MQYWTGSLSDKEAPKSPRIAVANRDMIRHRFKRNRSA